MTGSPTPARHVGTLRAEQGRIGGTSPFDAHLVTAPPDVVPALVDDVVAYANRVDVDPIAQAAIAHAEFEIVHPFADGNGRIGRVLVAWILVRRLSLLTAPPVSTRVAADIGGYAAGLVQFRLGRHDAWVRWFVDAVSGAGRAQQELVAELARLQQRWRSRVSAPRAGAPRLRRRRGGVARARPHPAAPGADRGHGRGRARHPVEVGLGGVRDLAGAGVLVEHGTVAPTGRGRPSRLYTSAELLGLIGSNPLRGLTSGTA